MIETSYRGKVAPLVAQHPLAILHTFKNIAFTAETLAARDISSKGLNLIKNFEGWSSTIYLDSAGLPTIGYGHLIKKGEKFKVPISEQTGEMVLHQDVQSAVNCVNSVVKVPLTQNQFDALVSLCFNIGNFAFIRSTLTYATQPEKVRFSR
jgi:GH24 family phage-related lysozyme (muramidase)